MTRVMIPDDYRVIHEHLTDEYYKNIDPELKQQQSEQAHKQAIYKYVDNLSGILYENLNKDIEEFVLIVENAVWYYVKKKDKLNV